MPKTNKMTNKSNSKSKSQGKKKQGGRKVPTVLRRVAKSLVRRGLPALGSAAAAHVGVPRSVGRKAGNVVAAHISRLIGSGDYTVGTPTHNSLIRGAGGSAPSFDPRSARFTHREYICDIFTDPNTVGAFAINQLICNPSDAYTFPYISNFAALYEKYKFHGLVFEYVSTVGTYAGTTLGAVIMTSAQNTSTSKFQNKAQMENMEYAISCRTDVNALYGVECKDQVQNWYYTKHIGATAKANSNNANIYDLADFTIATYGGNIPVGTNIGELWVSVDVEFSGPRLPDQRAALAHIYSASGSTASLFTSTTQNLSGTLANVTVGTNTLSFNNVIIGDAYLVFMQISSATAFTSISHTSTGTSDVNSFSNESATTETDVGTETVMAFITTITAKNASLTFSTTGVTTHTGFDILITPVSFGVPLGVY